MKGKYIELDVYRGFLLGAAEPINEDRALYRRWRVSQRFVEAAGKDDSKSLSYIPSKTRGFLRARQ